MKKLLLTLTFIFCASLAYAQKTPKGVTYDAQILRITDGDTVVIAAAFLPKPLKPELAIRVFGVDTPEKSFRAQCPKEEAMGQAASAFTKRAVEVATKRQVILMDWDKYGGRVLGDVILDGQSLRTMLITKGYAREYYGEAKQSWCN